MLNGRVDALWIQRPRPNPRARMRLFCFPYAGSGPSIFRTWSDGLPGDVEVCAIQLPGREARLGEPPFSDMTALIPPLADGVRPYLDLPAAFFGHSMGAAIAFELASRLYGQEGHGPVHLFVSGRHAPHLPDVAPPIHGLPTSAFVEELSRRYGGIPQAVLQNAELMQLFLPTLRADFTLIERYRSSPKTVIPCAVTVFGGTQDHRVSDASLAAWQVLTTGPFAQHIFPGGHFFLQSARAALLETVAQHLRVSLNRHHPAALRNASMDQTASASPVRAGV